MFDAYDTDNNGSLSPEEVYMMLQKIFASRGQLLMHDELKTMVENAFLQTDVNRDGLITFDEFAQSQDFRNLVLQQMIT
jgi:Ca2+-binding EF-hand superfamily protein